MAIKNPPAWLFDSLHRATAVVGDGEWSGAPAQAASRQIEIRRIGVADLITALRLGAADFAANRTDILFLCVIYPAVGLLLGRVASGYGLLAMLFPLASGFALIGPFAAIGLNDMSRRRERGEAVTWTDAFTVLRSPAIGSIALFGLMLGLLLMIWLEVAQLIALHTLGAEQPASVGAFAHDVLTTGPGWALAVLGIGAGFVFAALVLAVSIVSFPLMIDRNVGIGTAVQTSLRVTAANPVPVAAWGLIIAGGLVLGSVPVFLGLILVMPVLGHATWHLYRMLVR